MKIISILATLALLASCTKAPVAPIPSVPKVEVPAERASTGEMQKPDSMGTSEPKMEDMMKDMSGTMMEQSGVDMMKKESMMKDESKIMKPTGYMNYDEMKVSEALASGQKVALFFAASWCPSCRALDANIQGNLSAIPSDSLIVKVDYDTSDTMKKKYGVTSQHTIVLIDKDMNLLSKKLGPKTVNEVLN